MTITSESSTKGGPGSGNFGHAGRPGKVGGSQPQSGASLGLSLRPVLPSDVTPEMISGGYDGDHKVIVSGMEMPDGITSWDQKNPRGHPAFVSFSFETRAKVKKSIVGKIIRAAEILSAPQTVNRLVESWANSSDLISSTTMWQKNTLSGLIQDAAVRSLGAKLSARQEEIRGIVEKIDAFQAEEDAIYEQMRNESAVAYEKRIGLLVKKFKKDNPDIMRWHDKNRVRVGEFAKYFTVGRLARMPDFLNLTPQKIKKKYPSVLLEDYVKAVYATTQKHLKKVGYKDGDYITLFRGIGSKKKTGSGKYDMNAIESWSTSFDVARYFASRGEDYRTGSIISARFPIERIVSTARSGFGCLKEGEVAVLGNGEIPVVYL